MVTYKELLYLHLHKQTQTRQYPRTVNKPPIIPIRGQPLHSSIPPQSPISGNRDHPLLTSPKSRNFSYKTTSPTISYFGLDSEIAGWIRREEVTREEDPPRPMLLPAHSPLLTAYNLNLCQSVLIRGQLFLFNPSPIRFQSAGTAIFLFHKQIGD